MRRAPQLMNGAIEIVISLSLSRPIVREAMTAGTLHPNPTISGTKAFPGNPIRPISRSITNAARDMYPESSRTDRLR